MSDESTTGFHNLWRADRLTGGLAFAWLGQAGFAVRSQGCRWLIDPYLSDFLQHKYRGKEFPHVRMMQAPTRPEAVQGLDFIFCTHRHSDHMDPGSLPLLAEHNPRCRFVVPRAETEAAIKAGVPEDRITGVNAGEMLPISHDISVHVIAAAHESLKVNERGEHHFLGFIFQTPRWNLYHSGDCVPYAGLVEALTRHRIDVALLPVNGRDAYRASHGVPGNLTFTEARDLCRAAGIRFFVPHHFGMFDFNTPTPAQIDAESRVTFDGVCAVPTLERYYTIEDEPFPQIAAH